METSNDLKEYHRLMDTFIAHWTSMDAALGSEPLVLPGELTLAGLIELKTTLTILYQAVESGDNLAKMGADGREGLKAGLLPQLAQFRATVIGLLPGSSYEKALFETPAKTAAQGVIVKALQDALDLWAQLEADSTVTLKKPLTLADGTTKADLSVGFAALQSAYSGVALGKAAASEARAQRNALLKTLDAHLKQYPKTAKARLAHSHALLTNLPSISR